MAISNLDDKTITKSSNLDVSIVSPWSNIIIPRFFASFEHSIKWSLMLSWEIGSCLVILESPVTSNYVLFLLSLWLVNKNFGSLIQFFFINTQLTINIAWTMQLCISIDIRQNTMRSDYFNNWLRVCIYSKHFRTKYWSLRSSLSIKILQSSVSTNAERSSRTKRQIFFLLISLENY